MPSKLLLLKAAARKVKAKVRAVLPPKRRKAPLVEPPPSPPLHPQPTGPSRLLSLPAEIRNMIYVYLMEDYRVRCINREIPLLWNQPDIRGSAIIDAYFKWPVPQAFLISKTFTAELNHAIYPTLDSYTPTILLLASGDHPAQLRMDEELYDILQGDRDLITSQATVIPGAHRDFLDIMDIVNSGDQTVLKIYNRRGHSLRLVREIAEQLADFDWDDNVFADWATIWHHYIENDPFLIHQVRLGTVPGETYVQYIR